MRNKIHKMFFSRFVEPKSCQVLKPSLVIPTQDLQILDGLSFRTTSWLLALATLTDFSLWLVTLDPLFFSSSNFVFFYPILILCSYRTGDKPKKFLDHGSLWSDQVQRPSQYFENTSILGLIPSFYL